MQSIAEVAQKLIERMPDAARQPRPDPKPYQLPKKPLHLFTVDELQEAQAHCRHCNGTGYTSREVPVNDPDFGKVQKCPHCFQYTQEQRSRELVEAMRPILNKYSMLKDELLGCSFKNFDAALAPDAHREVHEWAVRIHSGSSAHPWLYMYGPTGNGKTHLAAAAANGLNIVHVPVMFTTFTELCGMAGANNFQDKDAVISALQRIHVLIIDDILDYELTVDWKLTLLFRILDRRYIGRKPTLIISNLPLTSSTSASIQDYDPRIASRLGDKSLCREVMNLAPDHRT